MISEHEINQVMSDTGMDYMQARNHVKCRQIHRDIVQSAHAARMRSLTERALADAPLNLPTPSVPHVVNPPN